MERIKLAFFALLTLIASAMPAAAAAANKPVKFTEVRNYFHNNGAPQPKSPLITTAKEFGSMFSPAAVMGKDGEPTAINFNRQAVIAIVLPETGRATEIKDVSLTSTGKGSLRLAYTVHYGARLSYTIQPVRLLAIDGKYRKANVEVKANVIADPETTTTEYRNTHYVDDQRHIDISMDYPTVAENSLKESVLNYEADILAGLPAMFSYNDGAKPVRYNGDATDFEKMRQYYTEIIADSMKEVDKENAAPDRPCGAQLSILRTDETARYLTFNVSGYMYSGGAHGLSINRGATFDKETGKRADIVVASDTLKKLIATKLPAEVMDFQDNHVPPMPQNPAFIKDGKVVLIYETGEIAANAAGSITVEFWPYEIEQYLTSEGKRLTNAE